MTYSAQFRKKLLGVMKKEKLTLEEAAKRFDVGSASIAEAV
jgi:transposase